MSKRKSNETDEERWQRKMKKYECKLNEVRSKRVNRIIYSSDEDHDITEDHLEIVPASPDECAGYTMECTVDVHNNAVPIEDDIIEDAAAVQSTAMPVTIGVSDAVTSGIAAVVVTDNAPAISVTESTPVIAESTLDDTDSFDPELLRALGELEPDSVEWGENLHDDLSKQFQRILLNGLKKEAKEDLNKRYLFPKNVPYAKAPTLNPEIAAMLTESCRNRDKRICDKQEIIGRALTALGKALTTLLKKKSNIPEVIRTLNDAGKLIADAHFAETDTRRSVVIPLVDKSLIDPFKDRKRDGFLFGEKLGDLVKNSRGINKTGQLIQATSTAVASSSTLNWKGPSSRPRYPRGGHSYPSRGGGQRTAYQNRTRAPPAPGPPARRPPPPPPPRRRPAQAPHLPAARRPT